MTNHDKIIINITDYQNNKNFVHYGVQLAKRLDRPATLTGVTRLPKTLKASSTSGAITPDYHNTDIETIRKREEAILQKICMKAREQYSSLDYEVEIGFPEAVIVEKTAKENPFMVLVEGDNNLSTIAEWFGTYETRLAEHADAPVLIVPKNYAWKPVQDILYVMELDDHKAQNIRNLHRIATVLNANLHIKLVATEDTAEIRNKYDHIVNTMQTFYNYLAVRYSLSTDVSSAEEIGDMSERMLINWLAIEHAEESFISRIFSNLNSDRIILQSDIPVLVF